MSKRPGPFDALSIPTPCPADWQTMTGDRRRRFCEECNKYVYDLSAMSRDEAEALVARFEGRLCARFERDADGVIITDDLHAAPQLISRRVSPVAAALVTAIIGLSGNVMAMTTHASAPVAIHAQSGKDDRAPQPQGGTASLAGTIKDPQEAIIPGAKLTLINEATGEPCSAATTGEDGSFSFTSLAEGSYTLSVVAIGFTPVQLTSLKVGAGESARADVVLQAGKSLMGGSIVAPPHPLRVLHRDSDLIVVGRVGRSVPVKRAEDNEMMKTTVEITSVVKGKGKPSKVTVYNWGWGEDKQFIGGLKTGDAALFFLKKRNQGDGFEVSDYSEGVKKLAPADLSVYLERLNELNAMTTADTAAIVEWLVRCAEQRATRWEGAYELARSVKEEEEENEPEDTEESEPNQAGDDAPATISVASPGKPTTPPEATAATAQTCSKPNDSLRFGAALSSEQKSRLLTALFSLDTLTGSDMELVTLAQHWKDNRLIPFLLDQLHRVESNPPPHAVGILYALAEAMHDEDLKSLVEAYNDKATYEDLKEETDAAAETEPGEEVDNKSSDAAKEKVKDAETARQQRSQMVHHFLTMVEKKRAR